MLSRDGDRINGYHSMVVKRRFTFYELMIRFLMQSHHQQHQPPRHDLQQ